MRITYNLNMPQLCARRGWRGERGISYMLPVSYAQNGSFSFFFFAKWSQYKVGVQVDGPTGERAKTEKCPCTAEGLSSNKTLLR